jgi:hypothetical protein
MMNAKDLEENPTLKQVVDPDNDIKNILVEYVGEKLNPEDQLVTVDMVIGILADEFPDLVLALAEENWVRGYEQGLTDVESGMSLVEQDNEKRKTCKVCEN